MVKIGVLRQHTYIHTASIVLKIRRGTTVTVQNGRLTFNPIYGVEIVKVSERFYVSFWGTLYLIMFPKKSEKIPYPLSML